jgi:hypothetical protein
MTKFQAATPILDPKNELVVVQIRWREKVDRLKPFVFSAVQKMAA